MKRSLVVGENPSDVITKINDFIGDGENVEKIMNDIGLLMRKLDDIEYTINGLGDKHYREEVLGYITSSRNYAMSMIDAIDSMIEEV